MRKIKQNCKIACIAMLGFGLQGCFTSTKMAMDYIPQTAKVLIEEDIENAQTFDDQKEKSVSVRSMLASILGSDHKDYENVNPVEKREPITTPSLASSSLQPQDFQDFVTPVFYAALPLPQKKPARVAAVQKTLEVIDLQIDDNIITAVKQQTQNHTDDTASAEISIGPVAEAEDAQMASLQAMAKASAIGKELRGKFKFVKIKFNPLQPFGTVKITIKGKKQNA